MSPNSNKSFAARLVTNQSTGLLLRNYLLYCADDREIRAVGAQFLPKEDVAIHPVRIVLNLMIGKQVPNRLVRSLHRSIGFLLFERLNLLGRCGRRNRRWWWFGPPGREVAGAAPWGGETNTPPPPHVEGSASSPAR